MYRVIGACVGMWYQSFRLQLVSDLHIPNRHVGNSWSMKPMPVICSLVLIVPHCPKCGIFIGTLFWK